MPKKENAFLLPVDNGPSQKDIETSGGSTNAFDQFKLLLEQATRMPLELQNNENVQFLSGEEAQAMAQVVYSRWKDERKQLLSKVKRRTKQPKKVLTRYLPSSGPSIQRALHFHFVFRSILSIKNDRYKKDKPDSGPEYIVVPANVEKDLYLFEEESGSLACFSDKHGFPVLTSRTYQALQQQGITSATDIAHVLSEIYQESNVISPQRFEGHIQEQEVLAQTHNMDFTVARQILRRNYNIGYMDHHPISCIATGVRDPKHVHRVFQEVTERKVIDTPMYYQDFARTILEGNGDSLLRLEKSVTYMVDMFAHAIVIAYETPGKSSKKMARAFFRKAVKYIDSLDEFIHLLPPNVVVPSYFSAISEMALTLNAHQRAILAKICISNTHDRIKVEEAWSCEVGISQEYIPTKHTQQRNEFLVGGNIKDFLFFDEIADHIRTNSPHEPRVSEYGLRSTIAAKINERPASGSEGITIHDLNTVHHKGPEYTYSRRNGHQVLTESASILELFCYPDTRGNFLPSTDFLPLISDLLQDLHNPDIRRQCGEHEWEYFIHFLFWLHSSLVELSSQNYETDIARRDAMNSWMRSVLLSISTKNTLRHTALHCYASIIGYHQNTGTLQSIRMIGYSLVDAKRIQSVEPFITIHGDERPLNLALQQAKKLSLEIMWKLNTILHLENEIYREHFYTVSEQLLQISCSETPMCSRYHYENGKNVRQQWEMPARHKKRIQSYLEEHHVTAWNKDDGVPWNTYRDQENNAGFQFIEEELTLLNALLNEIFHQESLGNISPQTIQEFVDECEFFTNAYCFSGRSYPPFPTREVDSLFEYAKRLQELLTHTGWTIGNRDMEPITITQARPLVIFGPNMSGKSTLIRTICTNALLQNRSITTLGTQQSSVETITSLNGRERQVTHGSLFIEQLKGINLSLSDDADLMISDEPFRQTSSTYALLFTTGTMIAEALNPRRKRLQTIACNHPEIMQFNPLLSALGIEPHYVVTDKERGLHPVGLNDQLSDIAVPALKKHMPGALAKTYWGIESERSGEVQPLSKEQIHALTVQDIFGDTERERVSTISHCFSISSRSAKQAIKMFIEKTDGEKAGHVFDVLSHTPSLSTSIEVLNAFAQILSAHKTNDPSQRYEHIVNLEKTLSEKLPEGVRSEEITAIDYYIHHTLSILEFITSIPELKDYIDFSVLPKTVDELNQIILQHTAREKTGWNTAFEEQLEKCIAVLELTQNFVNRRFRRSTFVQDQKITATDCWNPLFPMNKLQTSDVVTNSYSIEFNDGIAGTVKCGEHHSGKTNNLRGDEAASLLLAQCFGWSTGEITLPKSLVLLSKTQPVYDTQNISGMDRELELRIMPVLSTLQYAQLHPEACVMACLDEPGVRTSPADARKLLLMLYQEYAKQNNTKLHVTTHIDRLSDQLMDVGVQTAREGFVYIDADKRFKVQKDQTDSRAIEIAGFFHFDQWALRITDILKQYFDELQQYPQGLPEERVLAYAKIIRGQREAFFS